jgi:hypothetical protein
MGAQDFLHIQASTPLSEYYSFGGAICRLMTNSQSLLESTRSTFPMVEETAGPTDLSLRLWVDDADTSRPPWPQPYVRGLGDHVFAGFDTKSSLLADLQKRRVMGRFSAEMAADVAHWKTIVFPVLMSIVAGSIGAVEIHASCVAKGDGGLLLLGPSRSGKSTLAFALTQVGFRLLSDDRVFCSLQPQGIVACALPRRLKLRPDAARWFQDFRDLEPNGLQNGEPVLFCEPKNLDARAQLTCQPRALIFLERQPNPFFRMTRIGRDAVRPRLEEDLLAESFWAAKQQENVLDRLSLLPSWKLQYNGDPGSIAAQLSDTVFNDRPSRSDAALAGARP